MVERSAYGNETIQLHFKGKPPLALIRFLEQLNASSNGPDLKLGLVKRFIGKQCFLLDPRSTPFNWRGRGKVLRVVQRDGRSSLLCSQLEDMHQALTRFAADPKWLTLDEVIGLPGWKRSRVWSYVDEDCTYLGRKLDHEWAMRLNKHGWLCEILVYSAADISTIDRVIAEREAAAVTNGVTTLNAKQAVKFFKRTRPTLRRAGIYTKVLTGRSGKGLLHFDKAATEKQLKTEKEKREAPVPPIVNDRGTWHPSVAAEPIAGCSVANLRLLESGKRPSPPGVKIEKLPGENKNHRGEPQDYWLEGPLHALRDAPRRRMTAALRVARAIATGNGNGDATELSPAAATSATPSNGQACTPSNGNVSPPHRPPKPSPRSLQ